MKSQQLIFKPKGHYLSTHRHYLIETTSIYSILLTYVTLSNTALIYVIFYSDAFTFPSESSCALLACFFCKPYVISHVTTYSFTPWCRDLLQKLTGLQLFKKFPAFLWNPKVHYRTHKRPPTVPTLGQPNPVHIPTSHLLEIHHNIIHPSTPRSPQLSLSLRCPHQDPISPSILTHTRHMPSPSHSSRFYHPQEYKSFSSSLMT